MSRLETLIDRINDTYDDFKKIMALSLEDAYQQGKADGLKEAQLERLKAFEEEQR